MIIGAGLLLSKVNYPTPSIPSTLINDLQAYYRLDGNALDETGNYHGSSTAEYVAGISNAGLHPTGGAALTYPF